jgi:cytochrome c6
LNLKKNNETFSNLFFFSVDLGEKLYLLNCAVCHPSGKNLILPEKNLKKENLESTGMNSLFSLSYQIRNGKNGMPAFSDRLTKENIEKIAIYILFAAEKNFENL